MNLAGITDQIRQRRQKQNDAHFKGAVLFQIWRIFAVIPACILSLCTSSLIPLESAKNMILGLHFFTSIYQSCGVASFFLATYTIFNRK